MPNTPTSYLCRSCDERRHSHPRLTVWVFRAEISEALSFRQGRMTENSAPALQSQAKKVGRVPSTSCRLRLVRVGSSVNSISIHLQESARGSSWACRRLPKQVQACKARAFLPVVQSCCRVHWECSVPSARLVLWYRFQQEPGKLHGSTAGRRKER